MYYPFHPLLLNQDMCINIVLQELPSCPVSVMLFRYASKLEYDASHVHCA